jgi:drug/metabolite transporter (DMT)-like permease
LNPATAAGCGNVVFRVSRGQHCRRRSYIVFFQILRRSGATNAMLATLLIPVTTILLDDLVLGESISPRESSVRS